MAGNKRIRVQPSQKPREMPPQNQKSAVPISYTAENIEPYKNFWQHKFIESGLVISPTVDVKTGGVKNPILRVRTERGDTIVERKWPIREGENKFDSFAVDAGNFVQVCSLHPLEEVRISFLFREG